MGSVFRSFCRSWTSTPGSDPSLRPPQAWVCHSPHVTLSRRRSPRSSRDFLTPVPVPLSSSGPHPETRGRGVGGDPEMPLPSGAGEAEKFSVWESAQMWHHRFLLSRTLCTSGRRPSLLLVPEQIHPMGDPSSRKTDRDLVEAVVLRACNSQAELVGVSGRPPSRSRCVTLGEPHTFSGPTLLVCETEVKRLPHRARTEEQRRKPSVSRRSPEAPGPSCRSGCPAWPAPSTASSSG